MSSETHKLTPPINRDNVTCTADAEDAWKEGGGEDAEHIILTDELVITRACERLHMLEVTCSSLIELGLSGKPAFAKV